ncbi:MAG TPA: carboxypeptidase-like regulatory domain-containing protein [Candidatus Acidoferrales bacterium]|nr:carboxypeptidase-like regulatory domain-containing protein [Candidatus Acidoferrales bacterium]
MIFELTRAAAWLDWPFRFALGLFLLSGCGAKAARPQTAASALLVGRVLIQNSFRGPNGLLPLGLHGGHIQVEVRSEDGERSARATTEPDGYFFIPNLPPGTYYVRSVVLEVATHKKSDAIRFPIHALKAEVRPQKIVYLGTVWAEVAPDGQIKLQHLSDPEQARERARSFAEGAWGDHEFVSVPQVPLKPPSQKLPRKERRAPTPELGG